MLIWTRIDLSDFLNFIPVCKYMSQFLAYLKCYFQMTFNTVTPALASPPPAYSIGFLHFLKLATSIQTRSCSTNKKICIRHLWYWVRCIWHIWPFKFCGYYYLNRFPIRHANPINPTLFERLVITIFALTGATPKKSSAVCNFFVPFKRFTGFLSTWHYPVSIFWWFNSKCEHFLVLLNLQFKMVSYQHTNLGMNANESSRKKWRQKSH